MTVLPRTRGPASESLQRRKPRWGDVGRCLVMDRSRVKQPSDDQWGRLWGFNVWRHSYFQGLGRSKNTTPHNLSVSSSYLKAMRQTDLWRLESPGAIRAET